MNHTVNHTVKNFSLDAITVTDQRQGETYSRLIGLFLSVGDAQQQPALVSMTRWRWWINLGSGADLDSDRFGRKQTQTAWCRIRSPAIGRPGADVGPKRKRDKNYALRVDRLSFMHHYVVTIPRGGTESLSYTVTCRDIGEAESTLRQPENLLLLG